MRGFYFYMNFKLFLFDASRLFGFFFPNIKAFCVFGDVFWNEAKKL